MRVTQGAFSFLPDLTDTQIEAQLAYALRNDWSIMVEHTDDPHPRNSYWDMWGQPLFDLAEDEVDAAMREVVECRTANPTRYVKVIAYDRSLGRQTTALSFIVNRPDDEPGFRLDRAERGDRRITYSLHPYATDLPPGRRYGASTDGEPPISGQAPERSGDGGHPGPAE